MTTFFFRPTSRADTFAIRERDWTYAVYFNMGRGHPEYELYNMKSDPLQMQNLLFGVPSADIKNEWARLHKILTMSFVETGNLPDSFPWPLKPVLM